MRLIDKFKTYYLTIFFRFTDQLKKTFEPIRNAFLKYLFAEYDRVLLKSKVLYFT